MKPPPQIAFRVITPCNSISYSSPSGLEKGHTSRRMEMRETKNPKYKIFTVPWWVGKAVLLGFFVLFC